ncbi:MAG: TonB-dependent receptor [Chitinophagaceae bacterium]|nr:TonB-dependent receptor [Chitinophagaceae bacterium]
MKKIFFVLAAAIMSSQLQAQDSSRVSQLNEVVVTATKFPVKTSLTGKVVSIITRQQLEQSGGKDLSQVLTEQTGLFINGANSNPGKDKSVYLRGARVDHTLITIDGVPVYDPSGIGGNFDIRNLSLENIERIEILKGSQSTLYGSDAIAGVINIITRKTTGSKSNASALFSYGSNRSAKAQAGIYKQNGGFGYSVNYSHFSSRGINEAENNSGSTVTDRDGYKQNSLETRLSIAASPSLLLQPYFRYSKLNGDLDQGAFTDELDYTYQQKSWQAGMKSEWKLGKSQLHLLYNLNSINRNYIDDSTKSRNSFSIFSEGNYKGTEQFADIYITSPLSKTIKLTAGTDFRSSKSDQSYMSVSSFGPYESVYSKDSLNQHQIGVYAAGVLNLPSGFNLELGSRINFHSSYGNNMVYNINPSYLIKERVKLFANISSGYRTPSLYQLFSEYGNSKLKPEVAISYEGGVQYLGNNDKFQARFTYFNRKVKDLIFFYFNNSTFQSLYINQDKQEDHGIEMELGISPFKNTNIKAFYTFVTGEISTNQNGKDTSYNNLLRRPKHSAALNIEQRVSSRLLVSTQIQYTGERKDAYFDSNTFQTIYVSLSPYTLWDIYGEYALAGNHLKLFISLRNITNARFTEVSGFNTLRFNGYGGIRLSL